MLCLYVYDLQQYGQLNNSCSLCSLFSSLLLFEIEKGKLDVAAVFNEGS